MLRFSDSRGLQFHMAELVCAQLFDAEVFCMRSSRVIRGWVSVLWPGHFAMVMLGTPTRGTSLTVIWNKRYSIWNASRFQRASGPVVFTA